MCMLEIQCQCINLKAARQLSKSSKIEERPHGNLRKRVKPKLSKEETWSREDGNCRRGVFGAASRRRVVGAASRRLEAAEASERRCSPMARDCGRMHYCLHA